MSYPKVFALIPHFGRDAISNQWLGQCIKSLLEQTVILDSIIVVDDDSPCVPDSIVRTFSGVSLYRNLDNTGPFSIIDRVFNGVGSDYILLQDSDDWSSPDRLKRLLDGTRRWQSDIVGCQMSTVSDTGLPLESTFDHLPFDPRAALLKKPTAHPIILPSSLISCAFFRSIGGLSTGLRFGADSEFVRRACFAGNVRNIPQACYFRRIHPGSLTQSPSTSYGSSARLAVQKLIQDHARSLVASYQRGSPLDFRPQWTSQPAQLRHVLGPAVSGLLA